MATILNPITHRFIKRLGPVHKQLIREGVMTIDGELTEAFNREYTPKIAKKSYGPLKSAVKRESSPKSASNSDPKPKKDPEDMEDDPEDDPEDPEESDDDLDAMLDKYIKKGKDGYPDDIHI